MRALDQAVAQRQRADHHLLHAQPVQGQAAAHHIHDRIQRAHLVEMDLVHRGAVDLGLRLRDALEDSQAGLLDRRGEAGGPHHGRDFLQTAVRGVMMMVMIIMIMRLTGTVRPTRQRRFIR